MKQRREMTCLRWPNKLQHSVTFADILDQHLSSVPCIAACESLNDLYPVSEHSVGMKSQKEATGTQGKDFCVRENEDRKQTGIFFIQQQALQHGGREEQLRI